MTQLEVSQSEIEQTRKILHPRRCGFRQLHPFRCALEALCGECFSDKNIPDRDTQFGDFILLLQPQPSAKNLIANPPPTYYSI